MIIRLLPIYIYLFIEAQNAQPFSLECTKVKLLILLLNNFGPIIQINLEWRQMTVGLYILV